MKVRSFIEAESIKPPVMRMVRSRPASFWGIGTPGISARKTTQVRYGQVRQTPSGYTTVALCVIAVLGIIFVLNLHTPDVPGTIISGAMPAAQKRPAIAAAMSLRNIGRNQSSPDNLEVQENRKVRYVGNTGVVDPRLIESFSATDGNRDNRLSWSELSAFQTAMERAFALVPTGRYLRPVEFLDQGGGDAGDWALITAELFRFWDVDAYVAAFRERGVANLQVLCLLRFDGNPQGIDALEFSGDDSVASGYFVPVDLTSRDLIVSPQGSLVWMQVPEALYGRAK